MENISPHITFAEATKSQTAIRFGIINKPDQKAIILMKQVAIECYEPCREHFKKPIGISSFYRSPELNKVVNGSRISQHTKGEAIDIDADISGGLTNSELFIFIKNNIIFDQLIWEFGNENEPDWVHVSYCEANNRRQIFRSINMRGKTTYTNL